MVAVSWVWTVIPTPVLDIDDGSDYHTRVKAPLSSLTTSFDADISPEVNDQVQPDMGYDLR